ncbi:MAG TPA: hypothetical protein VG993_06280 [Actinomycetota bacterium]|jgi:hypothetical protein|nr:hypothetical protein [Actinomycetota bacterium]
MNRTGNPIGAGLADQSGMVGKAAVLWLLILAVLGIGVADAVSIARTTLHASEVATEAAIEGASAFRVEGRSSLAACEAVATSIAEQDPAQSLELGRKGCVVDASTGRVTVTLRTVATTVIAGRFDPTVKYTQVVVTEANGQSKV